MIAGDSGGLGVGIGIGIGVCGNVRAEGAVGGEKNDTLPRPENVRSGRQADIGQPGRGLYVSVAGQPKGACGWSGQAGVIPHSDVEAAEAGLSLVLVVDLCPGTGRQTGPGTGSIKTTGGERGERVARARRAEEGTRLMED